MGRMNLADIVNLVQQMLVDITMCQNASRKLYNVFRQINWVEFAGYCITTIRLSIPDSLTCVHGSAAQLQMSCTNQISRTFDYLHVQCWLQHTIVAVA